MTDSRGSDTKSQQATPPAMGTASAALILSAEAAEISAEAEERDRSLALVEPPQNPPNSGATPSPRTAVPGRRRVPVRRPRAIAGSGPAPIPVQPTPLLAAGDEAEDQTQPNTRSELRDWIK